MKEYKINNNNYSAGIEELAKDLLSEIDGASVSTRDYGAGEITDVIFREGRLLVDLVCPIGFKTFDLRLGTTSGSISFADETNEVVQAYIATFDRLENERRAYLDEMLRQICEDSERRRLAAEEKKAEVEALKAERLAAEKAEKKKEAALKRKLAKEAAEA